MMKGYRLIVLPPTSKNPHQTAIFSVGAFYALKGLPGHKSLHNFSLSQRACLYSVGHLYIIPPKSTKLQSLQKRNDAMRQQYREGQTISELARRYNLSPQRVFQIVNNRNH